MFSEYQTRAALLATVKLALSEMKVTGYKVMARNPQMMANADKVVLLDRLYTRRNGFQSQEYTRLLGSAKRKVEVYVEEIGWQLSCLRKRAVNDDIGTMTGNDVIKRLVLWFNSRRGADAMRSRTDVPMAPVFCKESRVRPYTDDSDIHQYEATADLRTILLQTWGEPVPEVTAFEVETHPI